MRGQCLLSLALVCLGTVRCGDGATCNIGPAVGFASTPAILKKTPSGSFPYSDEHPHSYTKVPRPRHSIRYSGIQMWNSRGGEDFGEHKAVSAITGDLFSFYESAMFTACKLAHQGFSVPEISEKMSKTSQCNWKRWVLDGFGQDYFFGTQVHDVHAKCSREPPVSRPEAICKAKQYMDKRYLGMTLKDVKRGLLAHSDAWVDETIAEDPSDALYSSGYLSLSASDYGPDTVIFSPDTNGGTLDLNYYQRKFDGKFSICQRWKNPDLAEYLTYGYVMPEGIEGFEERGPGVSGDVWPCDKNCAGAAKKDVMDFNKHVVCPVRMSYRRVSLTNQATTATDRHFTSAVLMLGPGSRNKADAIFCLSDTSPFGDEELDGRFRECKPVKNLLHIQEQGQCYPEDFHPIERHSPIVPVHGIIFACSHDWKRKVRMGQCLAAYKLLRWHAQKQSSGLGSSFLRKVRSAPGVFHTDGRTQLCAFTPSDLQLKPKDAAQLDRDGLNATYGPCGEWVVRHFHVPPSELSLRRQLPPAETPAETPATEPPAPATRRPGFLSAQSLPSWPRLPSPLSSKEDGKGKGRPLLRQLDGRDAAVATEGAPTPLASGNQDTFVVLTLTGACIACFGMLAWVAHKRVLQGEEEDERRGEADARRF